MGEMLVYHRPVNGVLKTPVRVAHRNNCATIVYKRKEGPRRAPREMKKEKRVATTFERVRGIVAERLGVDEDTITMDSSFTEDLNADSLDLVEVIMALEQDFGTEIKDEDAESIRTVGDAVNFIDERS